MLKKKIKILHLILCFYDFEVIKYEVTVLAVGCYSLIFVIHVDVLSLPQDEILFNVFFTSVRWVGV